MMKEIGSEFWETESKKEEMKFFLSGRTALESIIRDILCERKIKSALLPSYCCHSVIEPFVRCNIPVRHYEVYYGEQKLEIEIPDPEQDEIFLFMEYFGYSLAKEEYFEKIREKWDCIIEDRTHSWLMESRGKEIWDYRFTSYRKWTGFSGMASAVKRQGPFLIEQGSHLNSEYEKWRMEASRLKRIYMETGEGEKGTFLESFSKAERLLEESYSDCVPSLDMIQRLANLDLEYIKRKRTENAAELLKGINGIPEIRPLYIQVKAGEIPLHVPILTEPKIRDELRQYLTAKSIYCPIHWPLSGYHQGITKRGRKLYDGELSLICDQRYDLEDIKREVDVIADFFKGAY